MCADGPTGQWTPELGSDLDGFELISHFLPAGSNVIVEKKLPIHTIMHCIDLSVLALGSSCAYRRKRRQTNMAQSAAQHRTRCHGIHAV